MKIQHVDSLGRNNPFQARRENPRTRHHLTKGSFVQRYPCQAVCTACHQFFAILDITCEQKSILEMTGGVQRALSCPACITSERIIKMSQDLTPKNYLQFWLVTYSNSHSPNCEVLLFNSVKHLRMLKLLRWSSQ